MKTVSLISAITATVILAGCGKKPAVSLDQGWTDADKWAFWYTPQGSQLLPYQWFLALEQAGNEKLFRDNAHMEDLGYLTQGSWNRYNPDSLPIGFTKGRVKAGQWDVLDMTCAACHTSRIDHGGKTLQIEGGPARADFHTMTLELTDAVVKTGSDPAKFKRFAERVVLESNGPKADGLRKELALWTEKLQDRIRNNHPPFPPGFARVDALGNIANQVTAVDLGIPENLRPPDAPVSYPAIWDAHRQDYVQWNGSAPNVGPGPVLRNIGEVLGVFGSLTFSPGSGPIPKYPASTVDITNLKKLENIVAKLRSPAWVSVDYGLPELDDKKISEGAQIYQKNCVGCHSLTDRTAMDQPIVVAMKPQTEVGTDAKQGEFLARKAKTGPLRGTSISGAPNPLNPARFGDETSAAMVLRNAVVGVMAANLKETLPSFKLEGPIKLFEHLASLAKEKSAFEALLGIDPPQLKKPMYKARPLNGVWATAPYLHNGSVPNLWAVLTPDQRPGKFFVGSRKFDSKYVGFVVDEARAGNGVAYYEFDASLPGNSNQGHTYGAALPESEKWALIEYLKSL